MNRPSWQQGIASVGAVLGSLALQACSNNGPIPMAGFVDAPVAQVAAEVAGQLQTISVREGDLVKKGQLLAQLDAREREAVVSQAEASLFHEGESLKEAEENLSAAMPTVKGAGADIERARATLEEAQLNFDRTQHLVEGQASTVQQLDSARARLLEAKAQLESLLASKDVANGKVRAALAAVADAKASVRTSQAALDLARVQLAEAQVLAPFDGMVVDRNLEEGEWVAPGTPVITIENLARQWVRVDVEETAFAGLHLAQLAEIRVIALPDRTFRGHVIEVGPEGDFAVNRDVKRGRPDIRTFRVRVAFDEGLQEVRPGMTAEVRLQPGPERPVAQGGSGS
jgi:multidrug resistance efflux pump